VASVRRARLLGLLALTPGLALACGGQVSVSDNDAATASNDAATGGNDGATGNNDSAAGSSSGADGSPSTDAPAQTAGCTAGPGKYQTTSGGCEIEITESCSGGTSYGVTCSCPAATCTCSESSGMSGGSGGRVAFSGCANVCQGETNANIYAACGFPAPQ
jgi:hypothetical protein